MKIISVFLMFVTLGIVANAQDAKIITEVAASSEKLVKNAPFQAEAVSESVQTLADGNRIVRNSTSKLYRNSEGRFRRETTGGSGGMFGGFYTMGHGVTLLDPVAGFRYMIDPNLRTTRQMVFRPKGEIRVINETGKSLEGVIATGKLREEIKAAVAAGTAQSGAELAEKIKEEIRVSVAAAPVVNVTPMITAAPVIAARAAVDGLTGVGMAYTGQHPKWETRTDQLGTQNIEGVEAEGTRTITTIPAGAIGNERPIEIVYEKWYSRELQLVVMSKHSDPRFGEQTYRLTNIIRSEPDPSLFTPPQGYRLITEPSKGTYTINAKNAAHIEKVAATKAAATVSKTKP